MSTPRQLHLGVFLGGNCNYHASGWRHPDSFSDAGSNVQRWIELAQKIEAAKLDMLFIADGAGVTDAENPQLLARSGRVDSFEPLTLLGALSSVTKKLGLVATCSTTYNLPFNIARMFGSLDQLSGGRMGWNLVTGASASDAFNFSLDKFVAHEDRYAQAEEFADVVRGLWDSIDEDALLRDKEAGFYVRPQGVHHLNHKGKFYSVKGPLGVARSPQGQPVLVQAGKSEEGKALSARVADVVFTSQATLAEGQAFYADVKSRAEAFGRSRDSVKIMPGISIYVGATRAEAEEKFDALAALTPIEIALAGLASHAGDIDLSQYDLDAPAPVLAPNAKRAASGPAFTRIAQNSNLTLRQLALRSASTRDHLAVKGTVEDIADVMEHWFRSDAADGFNLQPPTVPGGLDDILQGVVPELQRRGLFRIEYQSNTLREHLGLEKPVSRYVRTGAQSGR